VNGARKNLVLSLSSLIRDSIKRTKKSNRFGPAKPLNKQEAAEGRDWIGLLADAAESWAGFHVLNRHDLAEWRWLTQEDARRTGVRLVELGRLDTADRAELAVAMKHAVPENDWRRYPNPTRLILAKMEARARGKRYYERPKPDDSDFWLG
jgi:hypothetical protein